MSRRGETAFVIAPDVILDVVFKRGRPAVDAVKLFDAIALDAESNVRSRPGYVAPTTLTEVYAEVLEAAGMGSAQTVLHSLLRLLIVAPTRNAELSGALQWASTVELSEGILFATCQSVGARYLVTNDDFGLKRCPVERRTAAEMLPLFRERAAPSATTPG